MKIKASQVAVGDSILRQGHFHPVSKVERGPKRVGNMMIDAVTITHDRGSVGFAPNHIVTIKPGARVAIAKATA